MSENWKPGDVARWEYDDESGGERLLRTPNGWAGERGPVGNSVAGTLRRLVVIDPEDREATDRLVHLLVQHGWKPPMTDGCRAALREFANPTPPRVWTDGDVVTSPRRAYHRHDGRWWPTRPVTSTPDGYRDADMEEMLENDSCSILREQAAEGVTP